MTAAQRHVSWANRWIVLLAALSAACADPHQLNLVLTEEGDGCASSAASWTSLASLELRLWQQAAGTSRCVNVAGAPPTTVTEIQAVVAAHLTLEPLGSGTYALKLIGFAGPDCRARDNQPELFCGAAQLALPAQTDNQPIPLICTDDATLAPPAGSDLMNCIERIVLPPQPPPDGEEVELRPDADLPINLANGNVGERQSVILTFSTTTLIEASLTLTVDDIDAPAEARLLINDTAVSLPRSLATREPASETFDLDVDLLEDGDNTFTFVFADDLSGTGSGPTSGYEVLDLRLTLTYGAP